MSGKSMGGSNVATGQGFQPGNSLAKIAADRKPLTQDLIRALNEPFDKNDPKGWAKKHKINRVLVELACGGNMDAIRFVYERAEGKAPQVVVGEHTHKHYDLSKLTVDQLQQLKELVREVAVIDITPDEEDAST